MTLGGASKEKSFSLFCSFSVYSSTLCVENSFLILLYSFHPIVFFFSSLFAGSAQCSLNSAGHSFAFYSHSFLWHHRQPLCLFSVIALSFHSLSLFLLPVFVSVFTFLYMLFTVVNVSCFLYLTLFVAFSLPLLFPLHWAIVHTHIHTNTHTNTHTHTHTHIYTYTKDLICTCVSRLSHGFLVLSLCPFSYTPTSLCSAQVLQCCATTIVSLQ